MSTKSYPRVRLYGIFAETRNGKHYGFCESSFSMDYRENFVRVWDKSDTRAHFWVLQHSLTRHRVQLSANNSVYNTTKFDKNSPAHPDDIVKFFIVRVNSKSEIQIDMADRRHAKNKGEWRNRKFRPRPRAILF